MTTFTYDAAQRRVKESLFGKSRKLVRETRSQVDIFQGISTQTDALGNKTQTISDVFGRTVTQIDALGNRTEMAYNRAGELIEQRDPMGRVTQFVYDNLGRRVETIFPKPEEKAVTPVHRTVYNVLSQVIQEIDPLGNTVSIEYDTLGRRSAVTDAEGGRTEFTYDANGKLLSLKDPVDNVTSYVYDESGQLLEETNSLSKTRRFEYEGRLPVRKIDRNGRVIEFEYNDFGRPVAEKWLDGAKTVKTFLYTYDRANNMVLVDDGLTKIEYDFDVVDRKTKSQMKIEGMNQPVSFMTTYNELGLKSRVAVSLCDYVNDYAYNKNKQMISITQGDKHIEYSYNAAGLRKSIAASAGGKKAYETLYEYTGKSRLKSLTHRNGEKVYANYNYSWDVADRITSVNDANFGYDKTSQLTLVEHDELPKELYEYDANGNRKNYKTGKNNRLLSDGEFDYEYDAEGNRVAKKSKSGETTKYEWDHRNRLVKVVTPQETVEYAYDYQNQLIKRNDEFFIHDGWQIAFTCDRTGKVTNTYLWGAKQDELLCEGNNWTLCDYLGTIRKVIDSDGVLLNNFEYSAFGDLAKVADEGKRTRFRYTGKLFDDVSQLQWNIYRWYDAKVGQWLSVDPLGLGFVNHNLYKYSNNNPIVEIDSFGLLSNGDASYVLYCLFAKHPNKCGEKGSIITYLGNGMLIDAATSMSIDLMFAGITLPASLVGKVSVATLTQIAHMLLENAINGTEINYNTIVQALINVLGAAAEDVSILVPLVQHILGELAGYSASECTTIFSEYTTTPNNIGVQVNIACVFNVCAKKVWASLMFVITNWSASGACSYTCTDGQAHHKCCNLGLKNSGTVSISGSGHGAGYYPCTVNNAG